MNSVQHSDYYGRGSIPDNILYFSLNFFKVNNFFKQSFHSNHYRFNIITINVNNTESIYTDGSKDQCCVTAAAAVGMWLKIGVYILDQSLIFQSVRPSTPCIGVH